MRRAAPPPPPILSDPDYIRERAAIAGLGDPFALTHAEIQAAADGFPSLGKWMKDDVASNDAAFCRGLLDEVKPAKSPPNGHWSPARLQFAALVFGSRAAFKKGNLGAYSAARKRDALGQICAHMTWNGNVPCTDEALAAEAAVSGSVFVQVLAAIRDLKPPPRSA